MPSHILCTARRGREHTATLPLLGLLLERLWKKGGCGLETEVVLRKRLTQVLLGAAGHEDRRLVVAAKRAKGIGVVQGDENGASDEVAQGRGHNVLDEDVPHREVGACQETHGQEEEIRRDVLKTDGNEAGDREPDSNHLASHVLSLPAQEHRHAHEPIAADTLDEGFHEVLGALFDNSFLGQLGRGSSVHVAIVHQQSEDDCAYQVADPTDSDDLRNAAPMCLLLQDGCGNSGTGPCHEHTAGEQNEEQVDGEQGCEDEALQSGVVFGSISNAGGDRQGEHTTKADVDASVDRLVEDLGNRLSAQFRTLVGEGLVRLLGTLAQRQDLRHGGKGEFSTGRLGAKSAGDD
mmetsp:Transcript_17079/g.42961  ORF Transcript_17079/g.42961 Transcript_17079/m.42961 type:complete len:349 (-) Transcript_17079:63-1109(-)